MDSKATFPMVKGTNIRRNTGTGIEIHNDGDDGWSVVIPEHPGMTGGLVPLHADTLAAARDEAAEQVYSMRQVIEQDETDAYTDTACREIAAAFAKGDPEREREGLHVVFRATFSPALLGIVFEIDRLSRVTSEAGGAYRFVGLRRRVRGRWCYRMAVLADPRTTDGRTVASADDNVLMIEATCGACGETFNPSDESDTEHGVKNDGTECGGAGRIEGVYYSTAPTASDTDPVVAVEVAAANGLDDADAADMTAAAGRAGGRPGTSKRLMAPVVADPHVLVLGNPGGGFKYFGPTPLHDDEFREARTRRIEEYGDGDWWLYPLGDVARLAPIDDDEEQAPGSEVEAMRADFLAKAAQVRALRSDAARLTAEGNYPATGGTARRDGLYEQAQVLLVQAHTAAEQALALAEELLA